MTNGNDFAFAAIGDTIMQDGLTKREYIAAHILSGLAAASQHSIAHTLDKMVASDARLAVKYADQLINALNETDATN